MPRARAIFLRFLGRFLFPRLALPIRDRGKKEKNLCVLRETSMSAVLLECLFIDNEKDAALLIDEVFRDKLANEVA